MPDTTQLSDYIRYQLSSLNAKNKHHDFEDLCYQFARLAISPNFLPATGPVSSGGDQGRDSETFYAPIKSAPQVSSEWQFADGRKAAIACSLEKKFKQKIEDDVKKICAKDKPDSVYFFSNQDIPVASRHKLQQWAQDIYSVHLEIFDCAAISDQLTRFELFWIAQSFLNIPSEMYPKVWSDNNDVYATLYNKWVTAKNLPQTFSDFTEIKSGIRKATFNDEKRIHIIDWINVLLKFPSSSPSRILRRCKYEICVAALRGINNLDSYSSFIETYFEDISLLEIDQLEDTLVLLGYCSGAILHNQFQFAPTKIHVWTVALISRIEELLKQTSASNTKCDLLGHRAYAATLPFQKGNQPSMNWDDAFKWWNRLMIEVKSAPLFPLERLSDLITTLTPMIGDDPRYSILTEKLDELLSVRSSGFVAAEKCRDRAIAFLDQSRPIRAIQELHNAKIKWFAKETLHGTILSMLMLSRIYSELHLVWAAKYYALAASYLLHKDNDDKLMRYFPQALIQLFNVCYVGGEWISCIRLLPLVAAAHYQYRPNPEKYDEYKDFQSVVFHSMIIFNTNKKLGSNKIEEHFITVLKKWPLPDELDKFILEESAESEAWLNSATDEMLWERINESLDGIPFGDAGKLRTFSWSALGIQWNVSCANTPDTVAAVESFISCLQIVIVDLSDREMNLLPTSLKVEAQCRPYVKFNLEEVAGNSGSNWRLDIPSNSTSEDLNTWSIVFATLILTSCSLLPEEECQKIFEESFEKGLTSKTFAVRPYYELLKEFSDNEPDLKAEIPAWPHQQQDICLHQAQALAWKSGPGPGYTQASSNEQIANRYRRAIIPVRQSIAHLKSLPEFQEFVASLRRQGYLDWHILLLVANVALNKRLSVTSGLPGSEADRKAVTTAFAKEEEATTDGLLTMLDLQSMPIESQLDMQLATLCSTWGLVFKSRTPDFAALRVVLKERYGYMTDDVPHDPLFV